MPAHDAWFLGREPLFGTEFEFGFGTSRTSAMDGTEGVGREEFEAVRAVDALGQVFHLGGIAFRMYEFRGCGRGPGNSVYGRSTGAGGNSAAGPPGRGLSGPSPIIVFSSGRTRNLHFVVRICAQFDSQFPYCLH